MTVSKQLINLLGMVVLLATLVAGTVLIALPLYTQSQSTDLEAREVSQSNDVYSMQVDQLTADAERIDEITASVGRLRTQIPAHPKLDDVYELVVSAAAGAEALVVSAVAGEPVAWVPRTQILIESGGGAQSSGDGAPGEHSVP